MPPYLLIRVMSRFIDSYNSKVDSCFITSVSKTNSNALSGGEDSIRINLEYNGTPNGNEKIILSPSDSISLYDDAGIPFSGTTFTGQLVLNDMLPPSVDSISSDRFVYCIKREHANYLQI